MQTELADFISSTPEGREADAILRSCVHCGFCLATCPTYQLLGDELDSPRGRIYLIKQVLEGQAVTQKTQLHLDRCLTCRACETTCPSGVQYGRLLDIGRHVVEEKVGRSGSESFQRWSLRKTLLNQTLFGAAINAGQFVRGVLPPLLRKKLPFSNQPTAQRWPSPRHQRKMLALNGCVQPALMPSIDLALVRVLDRIGISLIPAGACCGALSHHLTAQEEAANYVRRNIDTWLPRIEQGAEAIVVSASGCGVMVKEYGYLMRNDPRYAQHAQTISELARDPAEVIQAQWDSIEPLLVRSSVQQKVAFHSPCTLQHGLKIRGVVESLLQKMGYALTHVADAHLCCGSAGTYSLLQPELAERLQENKIQALEAGAPQLIASANIGCITHLQSGTELPVRHWIELLDARL